MRRLNADGGFCSGERVVFTCPKLHRHVLARTAAQSSVSTGNSSPETATAQRLPPPHMWHDVFIGTIPPKGGASTKDQPIQQAVFFECFLWGIPFPWDGHAILPLFTHLQLPVFFVGFGGGGRSGPPLALRGWCPPQGCVAK